MVTAELPETAEAVVKISARLTREERNRVKAVAALEGLSIQDWITRLIQSALSDRAEELDSIR